MYSTLLLLHLLGATVWTGGHLVLALAVLPGALKARDPARLLAFESVYERIGMPALLLQLVTGVWMGWLLLPGLEHWLALDTPHARLLALKFTLLVLTVLTALDARLRIIPHLRPETLPALARRIVFVTLLSVLFVVVGASFRGRLLIGLM
jgi:putative copper export protein